MAAALNKPVNITQMAHTAASAHCRGRSVVAALRGDRRAKTPARLARIVATALQADAEQDADAQARYWRLVDAAMGAAIAAGAYDSRPWSYRA